MSWPSGSFCSHSVRPSVGKALAAVKLLPLLSAAAVKVAAERPTPEALTATTIATTSTPPVVRWVGTTLPTARADRAARRSHRPMRNWGPSGSSSSTSSRATMPMATVAGVRARPTSSARMARLGAPRRTRLGLGRWPL